jgi:iron complex transport system substrate-binding protein
MLLIGLLTACKPADPEGVAADVHPRIVSLSPAISRTLVDLGLGDRIVGRSRFCDFLDPSIPVVGDLLEANYERLISLHPTHVLLQTPAAGADRRLLALARVHGWEVHQWTALDTIDDIRQLVRELPPTLFEPDGARAAELTSVANALLGRLAALLQPPTPSGWQGRTLLVYSLEPVGVFGRGTYLHEVLVAQGAVNATEVEAWAQLTLEDVAHLNPQAIVLVQPGAGPQVDPMEAAGALATLPIDAVRDGRVAVLHHPDALRPCSGIVGVCEEMRRVLVDLERGRAS